MSAYEIWTGSTHRTCRVCHFRVPDGYYEEDPEQEYFATEVKLYICTWCKMERDKKKNTYDE